MRSLDSDRPTIVGKGSLDSYRPTIVNIGSSGSDTVKSKDAYTQELLDTEPLRFHHYYGAHVIRLSLSKQWVGVSKVVKRT